MDDALVVVDYWWSGLYGIHHRVLVLITRIEYDGVRRQASPTWPSTRHKTSRGRKYGRKAYALPFSFKLFLSTIHSYNPHGVANCSSKSLPWSSLTPNSSSSSSRRCKRRQLQMVDWWPCYCCRNKRRIEWRRQTNHCGPASVEIRWLNMMLESEDDDSAENDEHRNEVGGTRKG